MIGGLFFGKHQTGTARHTHGRDGIWVCGVDDGEQRVGLVLGDAGFVHPLGEHRQLVAHVAHQHRHRGRGEARVSRSVLRRYHQEMDLRGEREGKVGKLCIPGYVCLGRRV